MLIKKHSCMIASAIHYEQIYEEKIQVVSKILSKCK